MVSFACKRLAYLHVSHYDAGHNLFLGKKSPFMASILLSNWMISTSSGGTGSKFFVLRFAFRPFGFRVNLVGIFVFYQTLLNIIEVISIAQSAYLGVS